MLARVSRTMALVFAILSLGLAIAGFAGEAQALSDKEYKELLNYPPFKEADQELATVWKDAYRDFKAKGEGDFFLAQQREWLNSVRDEEAMAYMNAGVPAEEAYTRVVRRRINQLLIHQANVLLTPEEAGAAKDPDFYNEGDLELPY